MVQRAPGAFEASVYDISGRRPAPLHANLSIGSRSAAALKRARRRLELQNTHTDLIQDFSFPTVSHRIKVSPDGRFIFASGTYPPQIHVYDTEQLSLKFKRHVNNDIVDFQVLESDWRKFALLTADRYIDFHSPFGSHFKIRVPRFGRDLMLNRGTCDVFVCGDGADVWRLNLDQGRFLSPIRTTSGMNGGNNVCGINPLNSLLAFGGENCIVDIWDSRVVGRSSDAAGSVDVSHALAEYRGNLRNKPEISSVRFDERDGVTLAVGTTSGYTLLYDLRSPKPFLVKDQGNGLPIRSMRLHDDRKHCISADAKSIKVWERQGGMNVVAVEPDDDINHLCVIGSSGVMCTALEAKRVKTYYVPALGPAPKWCAFLDSFTEELEDGRRLKGAANPDNETGKDEEVYENYKFVSSHNLEGLGLGHLVGTDILKPYMHGYFVHQRLYRRAVEVSEPFAYDKYRKDKAIEKLEAKRQNRITKVKSNKVKVNQKVVDSLLEKKNNGKKGTGRGLSVLDDERFKAMFSEKDFAVEEEAERFQFLNPSGPSKRKKMENSDDSDEEYLEQFDLVDDGGVEPGEKNEVGGNGFLSSDDDEENELEGDGENENIDDREVEGIRSKKKVQRGAMQGGTRPKMYKIGKVGELVGHDGVVGSNGVDRRLQTKIREKVSLGKRAEKLLKSEEKGNGPRVKSRSFKGK